jgi:hypothetical protein
MVLKPKSYRKACWPLWHAEDQKIMFSQAARPFRFGKLVAVGKNWVTTAEDCNR